MSTPRQILAAILIWMDYLSTQNLYGIELNWM